MMNSVRILIVNPWQGIIGPNVGFLQLVEEARRRRHEVHAICPGRDDTAAQAEAFGATLHIDEELTLTPRELSAKALGRQLRVAVNQFRVAYRAIKKLKPEVICINAENLLFAPMACGIAGVPCAIYVRGARFVELNKIGRVYFGLQLFGNPTYLAVSHHVGDGLANLGISRKFIEVVLNGVDLKHFYPKPPDDTLKTELKIPPEHRLIGTVCHLTPRKGVHHLVEIMALLKDRCPYLSCIVVGKAQEPAYFERLKNRIESYGLSERMKLVGERRDISRILSSLDVMVHPSETESFGRTIAEAMAMGKPVIGFDVGAVPELVQHDKSGYIVRPFDHQQAAVHIEALINDGAGIKKMGAIAVARVAQLYSLDKNVGGAVDVLERIAKNRPSTIRGARRI